MTARDFCFWLQGKLEDRTIQDLTEAELNSIQPHLNLAFKHDIDPSMGDEKHQELLNKIHFDQPIKVQDPFAQHGKDERMRC